MSDAVGVCVICGMGLCMEHTVRRDQELWEGGYPFPAHHIRRRLPRILCPECQAALNR